MKSLLEKVSQVRDYFKYDFWPRHRGTYICVDKHNQTVIKIQIRGGDLVSKFHMKQQSN